ncbi:MAG: mechanosensitive ion channel family protein [Rhizobiaceae bacterium]|nr:mechanosensitive ion channel family protein [Rhizobiaceae bacterium]
MRLVLALLLVISAAGAAVAQADAPPATDLIADQQRIILGYQQQTDELEKRIARSLDDDTKLVEIRVDLEAIVGSVLKSGQAFRPRLSEINARLEQLGSPPADGTEPAIVTAERQSLIAEKAQINALLGIAEGLAIRINGLLSRIADIRRDLFASLLTKRYDINVKLFTDFAREFSVETAKFWRSVAAWLSFVVQYKLPSVLAATFFAVAAAALLLIGGRRLFGRLIEPDPSVRAPSYLSRLSVAFWSTLLPSAALAVFFVAAYFFYAYYEVLRGDIGAYLASLFYVAGVVYFVYRLARAVLSPSRPNWRLISVETRPARWLLFLVVATAFLTGLDDFLSDVYGVMGSPLSLTVGESLISTLLIGILVILIARVRPFVDPAGNPLPWHPVLRYGLTLLGAATMIAAGLGYIGLARFVSQQIVVTGAILATMYIGFLSARAVSVEGAFAGTSLGARLDRWLNLDDTSLDQLSLGLSMAINVLVLAIGVPLILLQWGFQRADITAWAYDLASEISIGSVSFSLIGVLTGVLVFVIGYFLTRWFQGWLDGSVMARGRVDTGVRNSIRTVVGYAGLAVAALIGVSAAGVDLSNLALIAGGLSLGIGFGLQNVVQNFVSGLILLAERPFKAGDWIVAGSVSGTVRKISVRATEIETFQRQTVILPNSELINAAVGNWTHRNRLGRVDIRVNVAYGSDVRRAHAVLLEIANNHPMVLKNPEPFVLFSNFGTAALEFEVRVFLADIFNGNVVQNDFRFAIMEAFAREGIDIPSTPRADVKLFPEKEQADEEGEAAKAPATLTPEPGAKPDATRKRRKKPDPD